MPNNEYKSATKEIDELLQKTDNTTRREDYKSVVKNLDIGTKLIGLILLIIGVVFLFNSIDLYVKIGVTLIIIGIFMIFLIVTRYTQR